MQIVLVLAAQTTSEIIMGTCPEVHFFVFFLFTNEKTDNPYYSIVSLISINICRCVCSWATFSHVGLAPIFKMATSYVCQVGSWT
jgi:hypothetical protein